MSQFNAEWHPGSIQDNTASSSSKTFVVPDRNYYQYIGVKVVYTTNATVGDRLLTIDAYDESNNLLFKTFAGINQAASLTYYYYFNPSNPYFTATTNAQLLSTLPLMILKRAQYIKVYDSNTIDPSGSGENMLVTVNFLSRRVAL